MNLFFWALLNLFVPIFGPIFTLALMAPTHGRAIAWRLIRASVRDGQLFWCAIGLCAAALYEAMTAFERGRVGVLVLEASVFALVMLAFISSMLVTSLSLKLCEAYPSRVTQGQAQRDIWADRLPAIKLSVVVTLLASIISGGLHFYLD
ncbi:hypothetical protein P3T18_003841 [Paraburkholderia sp. GAS199]|uniref:hypothetical protein n=1 Tax=Paraburkholderia sp. GAS199 TaxID=3035126 RepID=UPI003D25EE15